MSFLDGKGVLGKRKPGALVTQSDGLDARSGGLKGAGRARRDVVLLGG
jgi:hypothetical protein